ncbi:MAG: SPOR domain-containing protein [Fibrella sp.]|nr:SPOR domain-containing protein [Armatimonadota bacterium]
MASNYNNRAKSAAPASDGDPADLKLVMGVGAFIVLCFLVGYFVLGKRFGDAGSNSAGPTEPVAVAPTVVSNGTQPVPKGTLTIIDNTAELEAKRKKAEDEAKKKADEEAKKKADEEAKRKLEEEARENMASPTPTATNAAPDEDDLPREPVPAETPAPEPDADDIPPTPKVEPTPAPKPSPSPVPVTPDDPEDKAMSAPVAATVFNGPLYRVRVGTFEGKTNAETRAAELKAAGYETSLSTDVVDGKVIYRLQVAAYKSEKTAREFAKQVEAKGFQTTVSRN